MLQFHPLRLLSKDENDFTIPLMESENVSLFSLFRILSLIRPICSKLNQIAMMLHVNHQHVVTRALFIQTLISIAKKQCMLSHG